MTGMAFLYGGAAAGSIQRAVLPAVFAFLSNFGREVVKDVEDVKGDEAKGAKTFPVRYGVVLALRIAALTMILLVLSTAEAIRQNIYNAYFTLTVLPLDVVFLIIAGVLCSSVSDRVLHRISALLKIGMLIGIIGIIAGSL
jgi:geranylgeranylglycerol-phosphate geranylgeranyltransferase